MRDYQESVTTGQTDAQTLVKVIPMCRYASQVTQLEPQGALIAHLSTMSTSVISYINVSKN